MRNGWVEHGSHVLSSQNKEWGENEYGEATDMGGMKKKGEVQEYMREQTLLVLFLYQGFVLFKGGFLLQRDFQV